MTSRSASPAAHSILLAPSTSTSVPNSAPSKRSRKIGAFRSPSASSSASSSTSPSDSPAGERPPKQRYSPYPTPTFLFSLLDSSTPTETEHLLACTNSRYPGAPGTALFKAREAAAKQAQAAKREADKKQRERDELARLGVGEKMGKRSRESAKGSESPYTPVNGNGGGNGPTSTARRSARADKVAAHAQAQPTSSSSARLPEVGASSSGGSGSGTRANPATHDGTGHITGDNDSLAVPTSSNGRVRRPASRGTSPTPLTANGSSATGAARRTIKSPDRSHAQSYPLSATPSSSSTGSLGNVVAHARLGPGASSTAQPFQSSPLARNSINTFPSTAEQYEAHDGMDTSHLVTASRDSGVVNGGTRSPVLASGVGKENAALGVGSGGGGSSGSARVHVQ